MTCFTRRGWASILVVSVLGLQIPHSRCYCQQAVVDQSRSVLEGVWEQVGLEDHLGNVEKYNVRSFNILKTVLVNIEGKSFWISSAVTSPVVIQRRLIPGVGGNPENLDFVNVNGGKTLVCRYKIENDSLTLCRHVRGVEMQRPERIGATKDEFSVYRFRRIHGRPPAIAPKHESPEASLTGLWETIGYERDERKLETGDESEQREYRKQKRVYFFDNNRFVMIRCIANLLAIEQGNYLWKPSGGEGSLDFERAGSETIKTRCRLEGARLALCWSATGDTRPDSIGTEKHDGRRVLRLKQLEAKE